MLMPAAFFVILMLGAITVDLSVVHLAQRNLLDVASGAANDAATAGLPPGSVRGGGPYRLDRQRTDDAARRSIARHRLPAGTTVAVRINAARDEVTVELHRPVDYIFAKAIPGSRDGTTVEAVASATAIAR